MFAILLLAAQLTQAQTGEALIAQSKWPEAAAIFEQLTRADANDGASWAALGLTYLNHEPRDRPTFRYSTCLADQTSTCARAVHRRRK